MKHFAEARQDAQAAVIGNQDLRRQLQRVCLIWDLQGRLRVLLKSCEGEDPGTVQDQVGRVLAEAAGPFWTGETWLWLEDSSKAELTVYDKAWAEGSLIDSGPPEVRILERHVSKASWFAPNITEPWPLNEHTPPILSFYSFKGGVGRTTALVSLAVQLARSGKRVAVIDLDLEAPGLGTILPHGDGETAPHGVVDFLLEQPIIPAGEIDFEDYYHVVDDRSIIGDGVPITVVPAGHLDEYYLEKLARLDYEALQTLSLVGQHPSSPLVALLEQVRRERKAEYFLLDARAGLHDLGGLALSGVSHLDVVFGLDSEQSWRGMEVVVRFLGKARIERDQRQLDCAMILAMAPEPGREREEAFRRFLERSYETFAESFYDEADADPEEGWPLPDISAADQPHYPIILGFDPLIQRYQHNRGVPERLTQGDFRLFAEQVLERVGRTLT